MLRIAAQFIYKMKGELFATEELYPNCNTHWIMASEARRQFVPQPFFFTFLWIDLRDNRKKGWPQSFATACQQVSAFWGGGGSSRHPAKWSSHTWTFLGDGEYYAVRPRWLSYLHSRTYTCHLSWYHSGRMCTWFAFVFLWMSGNKQIVFLGG